jgi:hypothetical protein
MQFGPRRTPVWVARIFGVGACLVGAMVVLVGATFSAFVVVMGVCSVAFGGWMLVNAVRIARLRAVLTPDGLDIVAHAGRRLWIQGGLASAVVPWNEVQGFTDMKVLNAAASGGAQTTWILYTNRGDFTLNDMQWENLPGLVHQVSARIGRAPGDVAPERAAALNQVKAGERRLSSWQRSFGWIVVGICALLLLLILIGLFTAGFSPGLVSGSAFLLVAMGLGIGMIRFYRK